MPVNLHILGPVGNLSHNLIDPYNTRVRVTLNGDWSHNVMSNASINGQISDLSLTQRSEQVGARVTAADARKDGYILCYSASDSNALNTLQRWVDELDRTRKPGAPIQIVGLKKDSNQPSLINAQDVAAFVDKNRAKGLCGHSEVSLDDGQSIQAPFNSVMAVIQEAALLSAEQKDLQAEKTNTTIALNKIILSLREKSKTEKVGFALPKAIQVLLSPKQQLCQTIKTIINNLEPIESTNAMEMRKAIEAAKIMLTDESKKGNPILLKSISDAMVALNNLGAKYAPEAYQVISSSQSNNNDNNNNNRSTLGSSK